MAHPKNQFETRIANEKELDFTSSSFLTFDYNGIKEFIKTLTADSERCAYCTFELAFADYGAT